jgi:endo-1,4-beta-xylanase
VWVVQDLQSRGIPIDAVGHEMHININYPTPDSFEDAVRTVAKLGVDQQVTEFDMSVYNAGDNTSNYGANGGTVLLSIIAQQGYFYEQDFHVFRRLRHYLSGVTIWGMADDDTWLDSFPINRLNLPVPFDRSCKPSPRIGAS